MKKNFEKCHDICATAKMPNWLVQLSKNICTTISLKDYLKESCFYYCSGKDITPIIALEGKVFAYLYCDNCYSSKCEDKFFMQIAELEERLIERGYNKISEPTNVFDHYFDLPIASCRCCISIFEKENFCYFLWSIFGDVSFVWKSLYLQEKVYPLVICNIKSEICEKTYKQPFDIKSILKRGNENLKYVIGHTKYLIDQMVYGKKLELISQVKYLGDYKTTEIALFRLPNKKCF